MPAPKRSVATLIALWLAALAVNRSLRRVTGRSMLPTLAPGDVVLTSPAWLLRPRVGDLVVVADPRRPERETIKRAVAWTSDGLVVHGDNPAASTDSRDYGPVPRRLVRATVLARRGASPQRWAWRSR